MKDMTIKGAIDFAIKKEIEAEKLYEKLMELTQNSVAKNLFDDLRKMEIGHRKKLEELDINIFKEKHENKITIDYKISDSLVISNIEDINTFQDGLILAAHNEKQAFDTYTKLSESLADNAQIKEFFHLLAKEELDHKKHVETIYDDQVLKEN